MGIEAEAVERSACWLALWFTQLALFITQDHTCSGMSLPPEQTEETSS